MTYNPTRIFNKDPESEEQVLNEGIVQLNLDQIGQETNHLADEIAILKKGFKSAGSEIQQSSQSFVHNFLFLGA